MTLKKLAVSASIALVFTAFNPQKSQAETFTSADFLKWKQVNQESYFRTNIGMASLIALQNDKQHAKCLEEWYFVDQSRARDYILKVMRKYPDHHPRGVLAAIMEDQCGSFNYAERSKSSSR